MVTRNPNALSREERSVWWEAYLAVLPIVLGSDGALVDRSSNNLAKVTREMAWVSLDEYRRAAKGERS